MPDHADSEEIENIIRLKCARFTKWCNDVGILYPKLTYPDFFEGGLVGARVNTPIEHREAFLFVPYSVVVSLDKCLNEPNLVPFYQ